MTIVEGKKRRREECWVENCGSEFGSGTGDPIRVSRMTEAIPDNQDSAHRERFSTRQSKNRNSAVPSKIGTHCSSISGSSSARRPAGAWYILPNPPVGASLGSLNSRRPRARPTGEEVDRVGRYSARSSSVGLRGALITTRKLTSGRASEPWNACLKNSEIELKGLSSIAFVAI